MKRLYLILVGSILIQGTATANATFLNSSPDPGSSIQNHQGDDTGAGGRGLQVTLGDRGLILHTSAASDVKGVSSRWYSALSEDSSGMTAAGAKGLASSVNLSEASGENSAANFKGNRRPRGPRNVNPVPEPGTLALLGSGLLGLAIYGKRKLNREN